MLGAQRTHALVESDFQTASHSIVGTADLCLCFSSDQSDCRNVRAVVREEIPETGFVSHLASRAGWYPLACPISVLPHPTEDLEARVRSFGIWCASGLSKILAIAHKGAEIDDMLRLPPFVGWVVHYHDWILCVVTREPSTGIIVSAASTFTIADSC